ncbi:hypothetical protein SDC9_64339 [bioreactor metagenome]|uniref:Uncharacterized protein n=1 Tax=bioreactor metagenome TaxID=1076179 RepID=A0A644XP69_9ZZZZ
MKSNSSANSTTPNFTEVGENPNFSNSLFTTIMQRLQTIFFTNNLYIEIFYSKVITNLHQIIVLNLLENNFHAKIRK